MSQQVAENFIVALRKLESERDLETITALFADGAEVGNVAGSSPEKTDAREFWTAYRDTFGEVESTFRNKIISDKTAALEWETAGTNLAGQPFNYNGVSILETDGDKIKRFYAYFNPVKLGEQIMEGEDNG